MLPPGLDIPDVLAHGRRIEVEDEIVLAQPFWLLRRFRQMGRSRRSAAVACDVLLVAPLSGHFGWLMRDMVVGLLARHDVFLLEWRDARDVPASAGTFDLSDNIAAVMDVIRLLGPDIAVAGVSQAPTAILAATALLAEDQDPARPRALVLAGGFIEPRVNRTAIERMAGRLPPGWFTGVMAATVPVGQPGAGRRVYRGTVHGRALDRYLARHLATGGELGRKVRSDDGGDPQRFPFLKLFSTLMDVPSEFAEDNVRSVFRDSLLPRGELRWRGRPVMPSAIEDVALMTVEGGRDDTSGLGQTFLAHALCHRLSDDDRQHCHVPDAGHFGLFHGEPWRSFILPEVEEFLGRAFRR